MTERLDCVAAVIARSRSDVAIHGGAALKSWVATACGLAIAKNGSRCQEGAFNGLRRVLMALSGVLLVACAQAPAKPEATAMQQVFPSPPARARYAFERALYGRADLVAPNQGTDFLSLLAGKNKGQENMGEGLARPQAIAVQRGRVFVANAMDPSVSVFDLPRRNFYKVGEQGAGALRMPVGLSVNRAGDLFVADALANAILVFDSQGNFLRRIGGPRWFSHLSNVTADPNADRVYAIDSGEAGHRVRVFNSRDGAHLFDFGKYGDGPGEFNLPYDLAVGPQGQLNVVDSGNFRVQIFDHEGHYLSSFGTAGKQPGQFARPKEIAADAQGNLYVVDASFANFQVFSAQGVFLFFVGTRSQTDAPANYLMPSGIDIDTDGRLYLVDQWYGKIEVFRPLHNRANAAPGK